MKETIKIAFAHNNINPTTQGIMAGITEYSHNKGGWQLIVWPDSSQESLSFLKQRGCKGAFVSTQTTTKAKELLREGNLRKLIVEDDKGNTLLEIPATAGLVGALIAPWLAALGTVAALATNCKIKVERKEPKQ